MAEKLKKKPSIFSLKRFNSQKSVKDIDDGAQRSPSITLTNAPNFSSVNVVQKPQQQTNVVLRYTSAAELKSRTASITGISDLVQCPLCLETFHNPKMLPCQHTFCMACLSVYMSGEPIIECPICRTKIHANNPNFLKDLPSNLYIDSILQLIGPKNGARPKSSSPSVPPSPNGVTPPSVDLFAAGVRCSHCQTICDNSNICNCEHCKLNFCNVCWTHHIEDMRTQVASILKQLDSAAKRLEHKVEHFKNRCERITNQIKIAADEKINAITESRISLLNETKELQRTGDLCAQALKSSLDEATMVATQAMSLKEVNEADTVSTFINLHQNALQILLDVSKWDIEHFVFDKENFKIEKDATTPLDAESEEPVPGGFKQNNPLENDNTLVMHYRSRNFIPHYTWRKTSRPSGIAISPWSGHLYICGTDSHSVIVVEPSQAKIVMRLIHEDMLCPVHIAFMKSLGEIYVTDKWKHCIHVFSMNGEYLRCLGQKGSREGMFRSPEGIATDNSQLLLYIVDTGNDRVQIIRPDGEFVDFVGLITKEHINPSTTWETTILTCTEFNAPTSIAVTNDRIIILDSGNRRVKIYNKQDRTKILEFGSKGNRKGQFRQAEVLTVDPLGFIIVGDSGNCRVQIFKPNGQLVRVFGGRGTEPGKFGWISGIHVTKQLDIITSDSKTRSVNFF